MIRKKLKGEITVFFALICTLILALILLLLESARIEAGRLYMAVAANSSIDSLFSQYHKKLWEEYRLFGLEHYAYDQITDEMSGFMNPYFQADNWMPMKTESIDIENMELLVEDGAEHYEKEVLDYMKYGIAASVWSFGEAERYTDGITEGSSVNGLSDIYDDHAKEAMRLEEALENIGSSLERLHAHYAEASSELSMHNGDGFIAAAERMKDELRKLPNLTDHYLKQAQKMEQGLAASRQKLDAEKQNGNINDVSWEAINTDICEYESYVSEDGERRIEIEGFPGRAESDILLLDELIEEAREVQDLIDRWEPDDEDDYLDIDGLWMPVIAGLGTFDLIAMHARYGVADKETEKKLENIKTILNSNALRLVLPAGASVSSAALPMEEAPSKSWFNGADSSAGLMDRLFLAEYIASYMDYFGRGSYDAGTKKTGSGGMEIEYILFGKENDTDNLTATVKRLIEIRTGLNLTYLYRDSVRRNQARALAFQITGAFGLTPLVTVATFFILSVWALGQAVCDVRDLLEGAKVPFLHDGSSFYLTLEGLLQFASGSIDGSRGNNGKGMKYLDYLRMLLFFSQGVKQDYRCMDVIQMCLRKGQKDFLMERLIYSLEVEVHILTRHIFSETGVVKAQGFDTGEKYKMSVSTSYRY